MELFYEVDKIKTGKTLKSEEYYKELSKFSTELSKKIGIENVFSRKIELLRDLKKYNINKILEKYTEYSLEEIEMISQMEIEVNQKRRIEVSLNCSFFEKKY